MKRTKLATVLLVLCTVLSIGLTACMKEEDYYKKTDVDYLIAELTTVLNEKTATNEAAIATLRAEYATKIAALEATDTEYKAAFETLTATYEAKVEALEKADADNAAELAELKATYAIDLAALQKVDDYLRKYKISNKSNWIRETLLAFIYKNIDEDYPTLFNEHDMRR